MDGMNFLYWFRASVFELNYQRSSAIEKKITNDNVLVSVADPNQHHVGSVIQIGTVKSRIRIRIKVKRRIRSHNRDIISREGLKLSH